MAPEEREAAWAVIDEMELAAFETIQLQPGLAKLLQKLKSDKVCCCCDLHVQGC